MIQIINIRSIVNVLMLFSCMGLGASCGTLESEKKTTAALVELKESNGSYLLYKDGKPFYIKGAGLEFGNMKSLAKHGGNSIRTWRVNNGKHSGRQLLDEAHKYGLMVCMGLEIGRERHGFDYNDALAVQKQLEEVKKDVIELKDHPALLMWGIGNELNLRYTNSKVWDAVNEISEMIHLVDGNHPTTTMIAGGETKMLKEVIEKAADLDFLSFQYYGSLKKLPQDLEKAHYKGAYLVTEWGATGHWEVDKTLWGRPIEENSSVKALSYKRRYESVILKNKDRCLGSYVFLWGQKQERTPTWYGLFLESGEETEVVDMMHFLWNNQWPVNRSPQIDDLILNDQKAQASVILEAGQTYKASVFATDLDADTLSYKWEILKEIPKDQQSDGGDFEPKAELVMQFDFEQFNSELEFTAPMNGEYRLFVYIIDHKGHAATANIPFLVNDKKNI